MRSRRLACGCGLSGRPAGLQHSWSPAAAAKDLERGRDEVLCVLAQQLVDGVAVLGCRGSGPPCRGLRRLSRAATFGDDEVENGSMEEERSGPGGGGLLPSSW